MKYEDLDMTGWSEPFRSRRDDDVRVKTNGSKWAIIYRRTVYLVLPFEPPSQHVESLAYELAELRIEFTQRGKELAREEIRRSLGIEAPKGGE